MQHTTKLCTSNVHVCSAVDKDISVVSTAIFPINYVWVRMVSTRGKKEKNGGENPRGLEL